MKNDYEKLEKELIYKRKNGFRTMTKKEVKEAFAFCEPYKSYLDASKTEREAVKASLTLAIKEGFEEWDENKTYKAGDKVYFVNRGKALILVKFGKNTLDKGINFSKLSFGIHTLLSYILIFSPTLIIEKQQIIIKPKRISY